jgi:mono/diheme cytochrome c family protein
MHKVILGAAALALLSACAQQAPAQMTGDALVARGDYLVNGVVLCGDGHTPRGPTGEPIAAQALQGADIGAGPPGFANIAPPLAGIPGHYTQDQFIAFLQTGVRSDGSHPRPPMPPYRLNEEDARAVTAYIATLPRAQQE